MMKLFTFPLVIYFCHQSMEELGAYGESRLSIFERLHNTQLENRAGGKRCKPPR
jgi:hypothetical protein